MLRERGRLRQRPAGGLTHDHPNLPTVRDMSEPIHIISLGAGVQSSTMALMAAKGEITPMPVAAIFADTQAEPKSVYVWLDWLEKQLPFPVYRVTAGNLEKRALTPGTRKNGKSWLNANIPMWVDTGDGKGRPLTRGCTRDFKVTPILKALRGMVGTRSPKEVRVVQWIGISTDEIFRAKESRERWIQNRWPLIEKEFKRHDCLLWMERNGFPKPPRSACVFCPYHNQSDWRRLRAEEPEEFIRAIEFEKKFHAIDHLRSGADKGRAYLHSSCKPLSEVDFSTEEERGQLNMFNNECTGMCGV